MSARLKWIGGVLLAVLIALIGGPIFTTDFKDAAAHGKTWTAAIRDRFAELWLYLAHLLTSTAVMWPVSIVLALTVGSAITALTFRADRTSYTSIANRMDSITTDIRYHLQYLNDPAFADRRALLSQIHAFCITLDRRGICTPASTDDALGWMRRIEALFTAIAPFLHDGHIAQAKEMAARYKSEQTTP